MNESWGSQAAIQPMVVSLNTEKGFHEREKVHWFLNMYIQDEMCYL